ncbi:unnamed protein product [Ectocarpus sp. 6 AP-2014]
MGELVLAKFAGQAVVNIAELILECVDSIGSVVRGMKENNRHASQLLEIVEAIEPPIRAIQKKGTTLSGSESLRQLLETVQEIRTVLDEYALTCIVARTLKRKKIAKKFAWLGNNLTQKMHAVQLGDIADRLEYVPPAPAARTSIGAPAKNVADVLKQAPTRAIHRSRGSGRRGRRGFVGGGWCGDLDRGGNRERCLGGSGLYGHRWCSGWSGDCSVHSNELCSAQPNVFLMSSCPANIAN